MTASQPQPNPQSGALDLLRRAIGPSPAERVLGATTTRPTPADRALAAFAAKPSPAAQTFEEKMLGVTERGRALTEKMLGAESSGGRAFRDMPVGVTERGRTFTEKVFGAESSDGRTFEEKMLGVTKPGGRTFTEKMLGVGEPGGLTFEEKLLGVTKPGGPTFTEKMLGISKRGGKSPMTKLTSMIAPPTVDTSFSGMLGRMSGPAVDTSFPQLDRPATSLFKTNPREFTYVPNIDQPADERDLDLDAGLDLSEIEESEELAVIVPDAEIVEVVDHRYSAATEAIDDGREWLSRVCPSALKALDGASFTFDQHGPDHEAHVALGCRRTFDFLADVLCPAVSEKKPDRNGTMRELGPDNYVNRILRYLDQAKADDGQYELVSKDMAFLSSTFDHLIERCQKGVHEQASARETRRIMLLTWSVLSELAQVASR
jgi:hypothetical protein